MPSIINGLFAGRAGIASHGIGIAVVGDNISNANTTGYKASRAEFEDLIAGGQAPGRTIGSGSSASSTTTVFEQGSVEFTNRPLDMSIDGNGFFVVADGDQRFYTRAGNFRTDPAGFIVNQDGFAVLGFPDGGTGALEPINTNAISQSSVGTTAVSVSGNIDAAGVPFTTVAAVDALGVSPAGATGSTTTFTQLNNLSTFSTVVDVFDSLGENHTVTLFFFHTNTNEYTVRAYVKSDDVDPGTTPAAGLPRQLGPGFTMTFNGSGVRTAPPVPPAADFTATAIPWNNASTASDITFTLTPFNQFSAPSNILSITQDGKGIGTVGSFSIEKDGTIFALLSNGQSSIIGKIGLVNFSNPEGLNRIGNNLLQQSPRSGEPVVGTPSSGTFGVVQSGSLELSTVDIASEFVRLITLQRGFQANSRIITTINQLLNEIIQLA